MQASPFLSTISAASSQGRGHQEWKCATAVERGFMLREAGGNQVSQNVASCNATFVEKSNGDLDLFWHIFLYMKADSILVGESMVSESQPSNLTSCSCQAANRGKHIEKREDAPLMGRWHSHGGQVLVANLTQVHANANTQTSYGNTQQSTAPRCFKDSFKFIHVPTSFHKILLTSSGRLKSPRTNHGGMAGMPSPPSSCHKGPGKLAHSPEVG